MDMDTGSGLEVLLLPGLISGWGEADYPDAGIPAHSWLRLTRFMRCQQLLLGQHLDRTVEMYKELGFDVYLEEVKPEECVTCTICYEAGNETIHRIYTRPKVEEKII